MNEIKAKLMRALRFPDQIMTRETDPNFTIHFGMLPNPDPILAKMGKDQSVYTEMMYDPHIMGELRSLRSGLLGYEWRISPGADDPESMRAYELSKRLLKRPVEGLRWNDFHWNIYTAVLKGQNIYEQAFSPTADGYLLPSVMEDRPTRRFRYNINNELRFLTKNSPLFGEEAPHEKRFLITRHMPSYDNPYGVAVLSSCFWAYTFKHAGMKWFAKFAEKYGIPWAVGRYPAGSDKKVQRDLANALQTMVEDAVAAIPEGSGVELLERKFSGDPVQERLINLCNKEMSKALTSQTLATEIQGSGSRAASETHHKRQGGVAKADRMMVSDTVNQWLEWITELNFKEAVAPVHEFYEESEARKSWAETLDIARKFLPIDESFAYERLQITPPSKGATLLAAASAGGGEEASFKRNEEPGLTGVAVDDLLQPVVKLRDQSKTLEEFRDGLFNVFPDMDEQAITDYMTMALTQGFLMGMDTSDD